MSTLLHPSSPVSLEEWDIKRGWRCMMVNKMSQCWTLSEVCAPRKWWCGETSHSFVFVKGHPALVCLEKNPPVPFLNDSHMTHLHPFCWFPSFIKPQVFSMFFDMFLIDECSLYCNNLNKIISLLVLGILFFLLSNLVLCQVSSSEHLHFTVTFDLLVCHLITFSIFCWSWENVLFVYSQVYTMQCLTIHGRWPMKLWWLLSESLLCLPFSFTSGRTSRLPLFPQHHFNCLNQTQYPSIPSPEIITEKLNFAVYKIGNYRYLLKSLVVHR